LTASQIATFNSGQLGLNLVRNYTRHTSTTSLWTPRMKMS